MSGSASARAVVFGLVVFGAQLARAEPGENLPRPTDTPPFRLGYESTVGTCPNAPAFLAAIRARTDRAHLAVAGEDALGFSVRIEQDAAGRVVGRLEIREIDDTRQERTVESDTCTDVARALALVIALYLDPDAEGGTTEPTAPPPPPPSVARAPVVREATPTRRSPPLRVDAGGGVGMVFGIGPSVAPKLTAFGDVTIAPVSLPSWLHPSVRLGIEAATTTADVGFGSQRYVLLGGNLRVCPVGVPIVSTVRVGPCLGLSAGLHRGTSDDVPNARAQDKPWLAPAATGRLTWALTDSVALELEGGATAPLYRTRFFLAPDLTLFRAPAVAGTAGLTLQVRLR
jgi:hypothetical protein